MTKKTTPTKRPDGTLNTLCTTLGLSKRRVSTLLAQGMPDQPQAALAWRKGNHDSSVQELRQERIRLVVEQRKRAEIENAVRRGELMPLGDVKEAMVRIMSETRGELLKLTSDIPPQITGLDAPAIQKKLRTEITAILKRLHDSFEKG